MSLPVQVPPSIDPTGRTDVTTALAGFLAKIPDGSTVVFPQDGTLRIDGTVEVIDKRLELIPQQAVLRRVALSAVKNAVVLRVIGGTGVYGTPTDPLRIDGGHPGAGVACAEDLTREGQHGLQVLGVDRFTADLDVHHTRADAVYVGRRKVGPASAGAASYKWSGHVHLRGRLQHTGRQGVTILGARCVLVEAFDIAECRRSNVNAEANEAAFTGSQSVWFVSGRFGPARLNLLAASGTGPVNDYHLLDLDLDRPLNVFVADGDPESGTGRRSTFEVGDVRCRVPGGGDVALMEFHRVDGVHVHDVGGDVVEARDPGDELFLVLAHDCTDVVVDGVLDLGGHPVAGPLLEVPA